VGHLIRKMAVEVEGCDFLGDKLEDMSIGRCRGLHYILTPTRPLDEEHPDKYTGEKHIDFGHDGCAWQIYFPKLRKLHISLSHASPPDRVPGS
jgi:hypothetical protein